MVCIFAGGVSSRENAGKSPIAAPALPFQSSACSASCNGVSADGAVGTTGAAGLATTGAGVTGTVTAGVAPSWCVFLVLFGPRQSRLQSSSSSSADQLAVKVGSLRADAFSLAAFRLNSGSRRSETADAAGAGTSSSRSSSSSVSATTAGLRLNEKRGALRQRQQILIYTDRRRNKVIVVIISKDIIGRIVMNTLITRLARKPAHNPARQRINKIQ